MTNNQTSDAPANAAEAPITSVRAAQELCDRISATMDALIEAIERETRLVRAGHLLEAGEIQPSKSELSRRYLRQMNIAHRNTGQLEQFVPGEIKILQRKHNEFRSLLQINLAVLATIRQASMTDIDADGELAAGGSPS